jgi:hypothetical protein
MADDNNVRKSRFNSAALMMVRLDELQKAINSARLNLLAMNSDTSTYNYMVMINANDGLLDEAWAKLTPEEKLKGNRIKVLIKDFVETNPPITMFKNELYVNKKNLNELMVLLDIYCKLNKEFLDAHNLNTPDDEWDEEGL